MYKVTDSFPFRSNSSLQQIKLLECNILPPACISSAGIRSVSGGLYLSSFGITSLASKELGSRIVGSAN
jgi:hypothetical protein